MACSVLLSSKLNPGNRKGEHNMKEEEKYNIFFITLLGLLAATSGTAMADGYRNPPPTAESIGKSGVNMVFVDDASAISLNPANLAGLESSSFVSALTLAHTESTYHGPAGNAVPDDPWQPLPNVYYAMPVGENGLVAGLGITSPYGQGGKINKNDLLAANPGMPFPLFEARMGLLNINPSVGMKLGDSLSVGVGADIMYSMLEFKQHYSWSLFGPIPDGTAEVESDGFGFGGNIGVLWEPVEGHSVSVSYRSAFDIEYEGDYKVSNFQPIFVGTTPSSDFSTEIKFPSIVGLGYGVEITDAIRLEANLEWLEWSRNESMTIDLDNNTPLLLGQNTIPNDWDNTITVGVGGDWQINENWVVRAGYAFVESPIPDSTISPILPDSDRHALSLGVGYAAGSHVVDVAYTFSIYEDRESSTSVYPGTYDIDSDLLGLTYSYVY